ncbi:uncharacterized protein BJ212DRAFT_620859 [Suillus subaureus]|uniref:Secreted protein n=1 Tax=Suillus subaureus TaxID=48587 RepID=A0A9P7J970_9AGAM|nr:uncharacterized protein BJ212DRAFT_620859 [Suillus subaureus]KAG1809179.1 hypothetical protein BJ212DRAFT_620859 [Suillus subaureus]
MRRALLFASEVTWIYLLPFSFITLPCAHSCSVRSYLLFTICSSFSFRPSQVFENVFIQTTCTIPTAKYSNISYADSPLQKHVPTFQQESRLVIIALSIPTFHIIGNV